MIKTTTTTEGPEILLGRKPHEEGWRLPGGMFDPEKDTNLLETAKRELMEETGLNFEHTPHSLGTFKVQDWRLRSSDITILTDLYCGPYTFGAPRAGDDLAEVKFFNMSKLPTIVSEHQPLVERVLAHAI